MSKTAKTKAIQQELALVFPYEWVEGERRDGTDDIRSVMGV
jgi:hypothetical protein